MGPVIPPSILKDEYGGMTGILWAESEALLRQDDQARQTTKTWPRGCALWLRRLRPGASPAAA